MNEAQRKLITLLFFRFGTNSIPIPRFKEIRDKLWPEWGTVVELRLTISALLVCGLLSDNTGPGVRLTDKAINLLKENTNDE